MIRTIKAIIKATQNGVSEGWRVFKLNLLTYKNERIIEERRVFK